MMLPAVREPRERARRAARTATAGTGPFQPVDIPELPELRGPREAPAEIGTRPGAGSPGDPRDPGPGDGGGGGGGDGWDEHGWRDPGEGPFDRRHLRPPGTSELGFWFMLGSIATLFVVFVGAYVVLRRRAGAWPGPGMPGPPSGLVWSTLVLFASSCTFAAATRAQRHGRESAVRHWLAATTAIGMAFLALQVLLWRATIAAGLTTELSAYGAVFYSLTGLHAVHVVGGLAYLGTLLWRARRPFAFEAHPARLRCGAIYWHFMGAIWLVLFALLYV